MLVRRIGGTGWGVIGNDLLSLGLIWSRLLLLGLNEILELSKRYIEPWYIESSGPKAQHTVNKLNIRLILGRIFTIKLDVFGDIRSAMLNIRLILVPWPQHPQHTDSSTYGFEGSEDLLGLTWFHSAAYGLTWTHLVSVDLTWSRLGSLDLIWLRLVSLAPTGSHMASLALTWSHRISLGPFFFFLLVTALRMRSGPCPTGLPTRPYVCHRAGRTN